MTSSSISEAFTDGIPTAGPLGSAPWPTTCICCCSRRRGATCHGSCSGWWVLATLRYIHSNPKAAGVRHGFYDPYSNYGHDEGLAGDGLSEWHPAFLPGWGSKLLGHDPSAGSSSSGLGKGGRRPVAPGQQVLPWHGGGLVAAIPQDWQQGAEHFRRVNGSRPRPTGPKAVAATEAIGLLSIGIDNQGVAAQGLMLS